MISSPPLSLSQIGYAIVLRCLVYFVGSLYLGFRIWNGHVTLAKAEHWLFDSFYGFAHLQDSGMCAATSNNHDSGRLSLLGDVFKPVSWLAGDSRLGQTFSLRIDLVERQSLSSICPSTIISYTRSCEASLRTRASWSTAGSNVFLLDMNKPVTFFCLRQVKPSCSQAWKHLGRIDHPSTILITSWKPEWQRKELPAQVPYSQ